MAVHEPLAFEALVEHARVGMFVVHEGRLVYANPQMAAIFGYSGEQLGELPSIDRLFEATDRPKVAEAMAARPAAGGHASFVAQGRTRAGKTIDVEVHVAHVEQAGRPVVHGTVFDVSRRRRAEAASASLAEELDTANRRLAELDQIDALTALPNRTAFEHALGVEIKRASREGTSLSVVLLDCDGLRHVNETFGAAVGDLVLAEVGRRITSAVRTSDIVARLGGDEFIILLPATGFWPSELVAQRIRLHVSSSPILRSPETVSLRVSVATTQVQMDAASAEEVVSRAALALKRRKTIERSQRATAAKGERQPDAPATLEVLEQLSREQSYRTLLQPIRELSSDTVWGYELLARSVVSHFEMPNDFLRVALENNILTLVDLMCLRNGVATVATRGPGRYHLNLFPSTILNTPTGYLLEILGELRQGGPHCVELSEQQFFGDNRQLRDRLTELREAGLQLALDDVGFGRTSLELLILLEPDIVKIDRQFVHGIGSDRTLRTALGRLLDIVRASNAVAIAEGIETEDDLQAAREAGLNLAQGYLLGAPG